MNYKLAKELKDAGFPHTRMGRIAVRIKENGNEWIEPTLSELIEACGDCLSHIKKYNGYWWAVSHCGHEEHEPSGNNLEESATTPEEAVARLWLALTPVHNVKI